VRTRAATTWLLVLTTALAAHAAEPSIPFEEYTLPNGLRVILSEDHRAPQVAVSVWYHVGAANQRPVVLAEEDPEPVGQGELLVGDARLGGGEDTGGDEEEEGGDDGSSGSHGKGS